MKSANITHCQYKSTYGFVLLGTVIISLLRQGALQNSHCAALPGSIVGHTNSGQFISSLLSDLCAQLLFCVADADFTIIWLFLFDGQGRLECEGYRITQSTGGILIFLLSTFGSPRRSFVASSLCRDHNDLRLLL